jgi:hypothetical protein
VGVCASPKHSRKSASFIQFTVKVQVISTHKFGDKDNLPVVHSEVVNRLAVLDTVIFDHCPVSCKVEVESKTLAWD